MLGARSLDEKQAILPGSSGRDTRMPRGPPYIGAALYLSGANPIPRGTPIRRGNLVRASDSSTRTLQHYGQFIIWVIEILNVSTWYLVLGSTRFMSYPRNMC